MHLEISWGENKNMIGIILFSAGIMWLLFGVIFGGDFLLMIKAMNQEGMGPFFRKRQVINNIWKVIVSFFCFIVGGISLYFWLDGTYFIV